MTYETKLSKSANYGNTAETTISIGELTYDYIGKECPAERVLTLTTCKWRNNTISTFLNVYIVVQYTDEVTGRQHNPCITEVFGDFCKPRLNPTPCRVATVKAVQAVHDQTLKMAEELKAEAVAFYTARDSKAA